MDRCVRGPKWLRLTLVSCAALIASALVAPAASATGTSPTGYLEVCKTAAGAGVTGNFEFTISGVTGTVTVPVGLCSMPIQVTAGQVTVTEVQRTGFTLADITAQPADRLVSKNVANRAAVVNVVAGSTANQTIVTFTNKVTPKGFLEVCKKAATGDSLTGSFGFLVTAVGFSTTITVPVGSCSQPIQVPTGNATVTEAARADTELTAITATPTGRLVSSNLATRTAVVQIVAGDVSTQTIVTFTNKSKPPPTGWLKVCKKAGPGVTVGQDFTFTVGATTVVVKAGYCSQPIRLAAGNVTVTEAATAGLRVSAIAVAPATALVSSDLNARTATVKVTADQTTEVTFTNEKVTGQLKVCKVAGTGIKPGEAFTFTVGTQTVTVQAGYCSLPITLAAENVTVKETIPAGVKVSAITVAGAGVLVSSDLATGTAVVRVAPGTTEVTFTNTKPPVVTGCVRTKGYYKNHNAVVVSLLSSSGGKLTVGGTQLTAAQIDEIYGRNASNFLNQVSQQLITALLNQLAGASTPADVQTAINAAQLLVKNAGGPLTGTATSQTTVVYNGVTYTASQLVGRLSTCNEGTAAGGPPHCGD